MNWAFERIAGPFEGLVDGPLWDGESLLFCLVDESRILRYDPGRGDISEVRRYTARTRALALGPNGWVYGCQSASRRIVRFNPDGSATAMEALLEGRFHNYPDDLAIDAHGRIWFSDPIDPIQIGGQGYPNLDHASVLRLELRERGLGTLRRMTTDTTSPRGLCLSADGQTLFLAENGRDPDGKRELRAYPIQADGSLGPCSVVHDFGAGTGAYGLCVDDRDRLIACSGDAADGDEAAIWLIRQDGKVLETQQPPGACATNCSFGGADLTTLYVTTADGYVYRVANSGLSGRALG